MKSHKVAILTIVLVIITAIAAIVHLSTRKEIPEHALLISVNEKEILLDADKFEYEKVSGIRVNGKGEEIPVEAPGISLQDVLVHAGVEHFEHAVIESDDSYRAEVSQAEIREEGKVYTTSGVK